MTLRILLNASRTAGLLALIASLCLACGDDGESTPAPTPPQATDAGVSSDVTAPVEPGTVDNFVLADDCGFDASLQGTWVGAHIQDFKLKTWDKNIFHFHSFCGGGHTAVLAVLSTGWCGACEGYADNAEALYQQYKDQGFEVLWIVGEDQEHNTPTWEYMESYFAAKNVTFTVVRDAKFAQTYAYIDPSEPSLPHWFLFDGRTMELVYKAGGTPTEEEVAQIVSLVQAP
jgi:thiol-disulfide isomerase/thioredoxin